MPPQQGLTVLDYAVFGCFVAFVVGLSLYISRKGKTSEDYFLAGRQLKWWIIGFSMIAANISTEHFVGMSGRGFELGLAIASYEWTAAVAMVLVAWFFLPKFLRLGIYTIPEFFEHRYSHAVRGLMAAYMMVAYVFVAMAAVLYSGALGLEVIFGVPLVKGVWLIGGIAAIYTVWGGLKAVAWADLCCAVGLLSGGLLLTGLGFHALGGSDGILHGVRVFFESAGPRLSTMKPWDHEEMPWVAVFIGGLWIPQLFYWGLNQFIAQRALAAKSLAEAQKGVLFAACLKLLIPFVIVFPGIMAYLLYADKIPAPDKAYPYMMHAVLPRGLLGLMFAALFGAVMSTLDSQLNSASAIFTMDLYRGYLHPRASERLLVWIGRGMTAVFVVTGCLWAPFISQAGGGSVFKYIQTVWGFITPGIVAAFLLGTWDRRTPAPAALGAMILSIPVYALCLWAMPEVAFLHHQAVTFIAVVAYMVAVTRWIPREGSQGTTVDVEAARRRASREMLARLAIPGVTAALGGALLWRPALAFCQEALGGAAWAPLASSAASAALAAVTFLLLRIRDGVPSAASAAAPAGASGTPDLEVPSTPARSAKLWLAGLAAGAVLGLHVYMFSTWVAPQDFWRTSLGGSMGLEPGFAHKVLLGPLLLAAAAGIATALGLGALAPRPPALASAAGAKIDLTPSRAAVPWGILVILAVVALYVIFA